MWNSFGFAKITYEKTSLINVGIQKNLQYYSITILPISKYIDLGKSNYKQDMNVDPIFSLWAFEAENNYITKTSHSKNGLRALKTQ